MIVKPLDDNDFPEDEELPFGPAQQEDEDEDDEFSVAQAVEGTVREINERDAQESVLNNPDYYNPTPLRRSKGRKGRRSLLTTGRIKHALKMAKLGNYDSSIYPAIGVTKQTWYRWLRVGAEVMAELEELVEVGGHDIDLDNREERKDAVINLLARDELDLRYYEFYRSYNAVREEARNLIVGRVYTAGLEDPYLGWQFIKGRYNGFNQNNKVEISGPDGGSISITNNSPEMLPTSDEYILSLIEKAKGRLPSPKSSPDEHDSTGQP